MNMATRSVRKACGRTVVLFASLCASTLTVSCGGGDSSPGLPTDDAGNSPPVTGDSGPSSADAAGTITETGVMVDYETLKPVAGLTVTDNGVSTTTDAKGTYTLSVPSTATLLAPKVTGPKYTTLLFPGSKPAGSSADYGTNVIPDSATYTLEQDILQNDTTKALVQIVVQATGACASATGGTLQVLDPPGASVSYFSTQNLPDAKTTSFQAVTSPRPVAVVYDVPVGAQLTLAVTHPSCTLMGFPVTSGGKVLTGKVTTTGTEPGDVNAAIVLMLH